MTVIAVDAGVAQRRRIHIACVANIECQRLSHKRGPELGWIGMHTHTQRHIGGEV